MRNLRVKDISKAKKYGFIAINHKIIRKLNPIGVNIGMYVTINLKDNDLNIAFINEQFLAPYDIANTSSAFAKNCIKNYNKVIDELIFLNILEEVN